MMGMVNYPIKGIQLHIVTKIPSLTLSPVQTERSF